MCKLHHKMSNNQNVPPLKFKFSNYIFASNLDHFSTNLRSHYQNIFFSKPFFLLFSNVSFKISWSMCKSRHNLSNANNHNRGAIGLTWQNQFWKVLEGFLFIGEYFLYKFLTMPQTTSGRCRFITINNKHYNAQLPPLILCYHSYACTFINIFGNKLTKHK